MSQRIYFVISLLGGIGCGLRLYTSIKPVSNKPSHYLPILLTRSVLFFCSFCCFLIASWLSLNNTQSTTNEQEIVVALDVSQSMLVEDGGPKKSRLTYAKEKINELVVQIPTAKWGLTVFAGETQSILPLTNDTSLFLTFLAGVDHRNLTKQGTQLLEAIRESSQRFDFTSTAKKTLLVLSDGGDDTIVPDDSLKALISSGSIQVLVVGIGTASGGPIPAGVDLFGNVLTKQHNNKTVISKLQEQSLRSVADLAGGKYYNGNDAFFDAIDKTIIHGFQGLLGGGGVRSIFIRLGTLFFLCGVSIQWINHTKLKKSLFALYSRYEKQ